MAHVQTFPNGRVAIECPECGRTRDADAFRGSATNGGWFMMCKYCRKKAELLNSVGKPASVGWDDKVEKCPNCSDGRFYGSDGKGNTVDLGECYRCQGKAWQSWRDRARNQSYDGWVAAKMMQGDMKKSKVTNTETKKLVKALGVNGPSKEEKQFVKPEKKAKPKVAKPKTTTCTEDPCGKFNERDLFDSDEEYKLWMEGN